MPYPEKRWSKKDGTFWTVRYQAADGSWPRASRDDKGERWRTKRDAEKWAEDKEARIRMGLDEESAPSVVEAARQARKQEGITLGEWADEWYPKQDVGISHMRGLRNDLELHLLPHRPEGRDQAWDETRLLDITAEQILAFKRVKRAAGYAESTIRGYCSTLYTMLADAIEAGHISANPAATKANRGRRSGTGTRKGKRGKQRVTTDALGALLLSERMALLSGRDEEFISGITMYNSGLRFGELIGLEREFCRPAEQMIRVEWQLFEMEGDWHRQPPKDDSYRDVHIPEFVCELLRRQLASIPHKPTKTCACFRPPTVHRFLVAALKRRGAWSEEMKTAVLTHAQDRSLAELGIDPDLADRFNGDFIRGSAAPPHKGGIHVFSAQSGSPHHRRGSYKPWLIGAASTGMYPPRKNSQEESPDGHPVPLRAEPWPGMPIRGRNPRKKTEVQWVPIAPGITPHGLARHSHKRAMIEGDIPEVLQHERLGHEMGGIGAVYSQVTPAMIGQLMELLTRNFRESLYQRAKMHPHSPVTVLDELLEPYRRRPHRAPTKIISQNSPKNGVRPLRSLKSRTPSQQVNPSPDPHPSDTQ
ncbi:hypothetical protein CDO52_01015 [Nocardiopsis gilva YIM 90087]|uniref:Core-binding (CB) domain-containing protein n=1 Tax=Nocardiopsis gilva YIM 90087 TaxID=1235441 RepID=A0A223S0A6_9ACTN|nr:hypothetical protein [Nocardiopsis gilva]ASU81560.1 hypothetical protein CDO52_01015 [Nocardiopsis gilva YIM 90087]